MHLLIVIDNEKILHGVILLCAPFSNVWYTLACQQGVLSDLMDYGILTGEYGNGRFGRFFKNLLFFFF